MNIASIIEPHPGAAVALVSRGKSTTYGELRAQVAALRGGLIGLGLQAGDRVGIACGNNWYFVVSYLSVTGAGCIAVPLNPLAPARELERELAVTGCRALVAGPAAKASVQGLDRSAVPSLEYLLVASGTELAGAVEVEELLEAEPAPIVDRDPDELAVLMFTSGTAGPPRAAMLSHRNLLSNLEQVHALAARRQHPDDVVFGVLPLFHIFGLNVMLGLTLYAGSRVVLIERFDPASGLEAIERHGITIVTGPPTMWAAWAGLPAADHRAFESVRLGISGAAKLPIETAQLIEDRFGLHLDEGYGLTEASPVVTSATGTDAPWGSIGLPLPGVRVRLVDADGEDVLAGDTGEIWVQGPNVFQGYWNEPDATAAALTADGWLRTGDIGVVDDEGYVFLVDRAKDLIIVSGFNVYPAEVEAVLAEHPAVEACAVVGVPHPHSGEAVKAYVVLAPGKAAEEDDIVAWCAERLARYKCPSKVMFVDELPRGLAGKVLRRALR
ncbi:AMP-binding protein [Rhabdothermincola sp.]|uniref:AMP-binding protein n=1 Tax=Rhabdothermincola sp. TaxID=2820405 RepID=UPI002FE1E5C6